MDTVLVVEDEKMIRQGISTMIKRSGVPVGEVIECANGEQAMEILASRLVDVVFTDIRMPKMDGIELVHRMQDLEEVPLTVAVSGYDDFSYAVEMLRQGVREYILKPVERDKLQSVLKKLNTEIEHRKEEEKKSESSAARLLKYLLLDDDAGTDDIAVLEKQLIARIGEEYRCMVLPAGMTELIPADEKNIMILDNAGEMICLLGGDAAERNIDNIRGESSISIGISDRHRGVMELKTAYKEAVARHREAFCKNRGVMWQNTPEAKEIRDFIEEAEKLISDKAISARVQAVGVGTKGDIEKEWNRYFTAVERGYISPEKFSASIKDFVTGYMQFYHITDVPADIAEPFRMRNIADYKDRLTGFLCEANERFNNDDAVTGEDSGKLHWAIAYIRDNYMKDINMAMVSNEVSMNYTLFSSQFKAYTGTNFVNYIRDLRIAEAKRLLSDTDMRVNEIGTAVGYDNEKHFLKSFKLSVGVTPSEYRKNSNRPG